MSDRTLECECSVFRQCKLRGLRAERATWLTVLTEHARQLVHCDGSGDKPHTCERAGLDLLGLLADLEDPC